MRLETATISDEISLIADAGKSLEILSIGPRTTIHGELAAMFALASMPAFASFFQTTSVQDKPHRTSSSQAIMRGLLGRCPNCGRGHLFGRFLKVVDCCPVCGEELFHHRADDFPAYLDILLVGHTVVPLALIVEVEYAPAMWLQMAIWVPLTIALSLGLLQPIKGAIVAMQWVGGMHGFAYSRAKPRKAEAPRQVKQLADPIP
jgi:uncharacterized protein (DUF983 family)